MSRCEHTCVGCQSTAEPVGIAKRCNKGLIDKKVQGEAERAAKREEVEKSGWRGCIILGIVPLTP